MKANDELKLFNEEHSSCSHLNKIAKLKQIKHSGFDCPYNDDLPLVIYFNDESIILANSYTIRAYSLLS